MNFFQAQDDARRRTWRLAGLFALAVASLVALTNLLVAVVYLWAQGRAPGQVALEQLPASTWLVISTGVIGVVAVASLYKYLMVRGGGRAVAESLGGRLLARDGADFRSARLLNVVEEMAIASGIPVPPVYMLPEPSINAFAAGFDPDDAVIGVSQGALEHLSRDELQGVIGHEFSHLLNGDMRLNIRLIALLHGILFLGMIGYGILRSGTRGSRRSSGGGAPVLLLGVGLLVIGYAGTFFGNLIKAGVSRQREYLADAAAVQFTRNPAGIAGALKKIGGLSFGSRIETARATEASHLFFGQVRPMFLNRLLATHPPLDRRIRAIDPGWDGRFPALVGPPPAERAEPGVAAFAGGETAIAPVEVTESVGTLDATGLAAARTLIDTTDARLRAAAHDGWGCRGVLYAMLLSADPTIRSAQLDLLDARAERGVPEHTLAAWPLVRALDEPRRLALLEMAMPALKALSRPQYERFVANTVSLIRADRRISLEEWVIHRLLVKELAPHFEGHRRVRVRYRSIEAAAGHAATLLSAIARSGHDDAGSIREAFAAGAAALGLTLTLDDREDADFARLSAAVNALQGLKPLAKPRLLKACAAAAHADRQVNPREGALLQGIAAALDCPLPPSIYKA